MAQDILKSTSTFVLTFQLVASSDHIAGLTGKSGSVTVKISKNGASGVSPSGAIAEVDSTNLPGVYTVAGNTTDSNTAGPLWIYAKDAASDPYCALIANVIDPTVANYGANAVNIGGTAQTGLDLGANWTAARAAHLDADISSRLASASYTAPTNLTAAQIATGVWQDATAGDFTAANSIGKSIMNGVALGTGLTINGYTGDTPQSGDSFARIGANGSGLTGVTGATLSAAYDAAKTALTTGTAMTEGYATDGATSTAPQMLYMIWALLAEKNIAATTLTAKKLDGATTAMTFTLDSATSPTSITRAT